VFYAFDLLWLDGEDLRSLPLIERKQSLRQLIQKSGYPALGYTCVLGMKDVYKKEQTDDPSLY
jgi:bifunctional non-homologous end joining protein LigD